MANADEFKLLLQNGDIVDDCDNKPHVAKLGQVEAKYYLDFSMADRVNAYHNKLFQNISDLQLDEIYKLKSNKVKSYIKIIEKYEYKGELFIKYLTEDGRINFKPASFFKEIPKKARKPRTFPPADNQGARKPSIVIHEANLQDFVTKPRYYIITDANCEEIGSIILIHNRATKMLNTDKMISKTYQIKQLNEIDRDQAFYLSKFPANESINEWKCETFEQIKALEIGQECRYKNDRENIYKITAKNFTEKGIYFSIQPKEGNKSFRDVDASEIRLIQKTKSIEKSESKSTDKASKFDRQNSATSRTSNDSRDYMTNKYKSEDHSIKVVSNIDRQNSATSRTSNDSRDYMANKSVLPTIYCDKLGLDVVKPGAIDQIGKPKGASMNKYIAIEGQTKSFVKLQWKGKINNINCLGCELPEFWSEGTEGTFGRYKLFTCSYDKGVLIPINDAVKSCESADESNHLPLADNDELTANNICCFEPLDKLSKDIKVNSRVFCQQLKAGGKCNWMGLINGKGYVGIEFDEIIPDGNSTQNSISEILKIQGQIRMIPVQSVLPTIYCNKLGMDVIKPGAIDQIGKPKGASMNKYIAIQGKTKSFVKLFWKGKINNINCLGCELPEYWREGTEGTFGRHKLFTCSYSRGVLIPINDAVKSCESADESNDLPLTDNDELTENNICCFEPLEKLSNDIEVNSRVFCQQLKAGGKCKWMGLINGKGYVGIEFDEIHRRAERFNELSRILKIEGRIRFIPLECVENAKLHFIFDKIVDTGKIFYVDCEEDRDYLGNFGAINLTTRDGKSKQFIGELKWIGKINNEKCVGLDMEDEMEFTMDGIINQDNRFDCMEKHGLITALSNVKLYKYDNNVHMLPSGVINPDKYLRCKETFGDECIKAQRIKKDGMVNVKLLNGQANLKGTLKWYGLMNNVPVCAVQLLQEHENGTNGRFWRTRLFECRDKLAIATLTQNLSPSMPIDFIKDIFVEKNQKEFSRGSVRTGDIYHVGQFVKILPFDLFGQIECFHVVYEEMFVQVQLTKDQIKRLPFHQRIDRAASNAIYSTVILLKDSIAKCSENLEFFNESSLINKECIEYRIPRPMETFRTGDLIKAGKTGNVKYFIVNNRFIINGISCLSVMESILGEAEEYLPESEAMKVDNSELEMKYFQGVFIDPKSIRSFEKCEINDFCIGNRVEFMSMDRKSSYNGRIKSTGIANKTIPSCVVQMPPSEPIVNRSLSQYTLNKNLEFKILPGTANDFLFLIPANLLRKSELPETVNGIPVIDPEFIRIIEGVAVEPAKFIVFTCNNQRHSVQLKWKGLIDQKYCLGCVANFQCNFATNGTFGQDKLFTCEDKHGILIPLAAVSECCEIKGHKPIKWTRDGAIDENSICCTVEKNITKFQANCKLKNIKSNRKAIWKWSGLVNDVEVIGVEMNESLEKGTDGNFCKIQLFRSVHKRGALFKSEEFIISKSELKHVKEINLNVVDPFNVREIENGRQINKLACYKSKGAIKILNIKWRGIVNGELCVGCKLSGPVEWGTDGTFGNKIVFKCPDRRGVLIPTEELIDSCETTAHLKITTLRDSGWLWKGGDTYFINPDCICCTESTELLQQHPDLRIKSRIKVPNKENKHIGGSCEWIGLINGQEALGITMDNDVKGTNGIFSYFRMFTCEGGKGVLMLAENIFHDKESEKPQFIADKIVDINKIYSISPCEGENGIGIGKPIKINFNYPNGRNRDFIGEVKWTGRINDEKCVGLDMEEEMEHGMNGMIGKSQRFECMEKHGLVALLSDVELSENAENPQVLDSGMIAPNKFIRFQEERSKKYLDDKNIKMNEFVIVKQGNPELKLKGKLRWIGWMNKLLVCVIELDQDHENGSNGTFWRRQIVNSRGKRVIATSVNHVYKYEPYVIKTIPEEIQIFKEIVINSAVKYYFLTATGYQDLFGTVKWTGVDENDCYFFGLELDDRINIGTDGTFGGQRLFTCQNGHGVLAPLNNVASDTRFTAKVVSPENVKKSETSDQIVCGLNSSVIAGDNKGIQGNANSCYFDSALFALFVKSDVLDYLISPIINEQEADPITKEFREIIAWRIVYPLRKNGFVSFHHTQEMRNVIQKYGAKFAEMMKQETDMENVFTLLSKLCPKEQLLSIISHNGCQINSMFMQLFLTVDKKVRFMTSEEMLKISMVQNDIKFNELPTCLIMQAPRDAKGTNSYEYALPLNEIEISQICSNYLKNCSKCNGEAEFQCKTCLRNELDITCTFLCSQHKCQHPACTKLRPDMVKSKSKVFMELQAIICIEKCHFVSFVKQVERLTNEQVEKLRAKQMDIKNEINWFFFDSMSSQSISSSYAIPRVSRCECVSKFLSLSEDQMKQYIGSNDLKELKMILEDSCVYIYHNKSKTCY